MKKIFFVMAYLNLVARVVVGQVTFQNVNSFEIEQSINEISDKVTIKLPRNYQKLDGKPVKDYINPGDKIYVQCGYLETGSNVEFSGYAKEIGADIPLEIIGDNMFTFRGNNIIKSYKTVTLRELLTEITKDIPSFGGSPYKIECPDANLGKFIIDNASSYQVLSKLKEGFGFYSRIYADVLHVGFAWDWKPQYAGKHIYTIQENVKEKSSLKFKAAKDFNTKVKVKINYPNGSTAFVEAGSKEKDAAVHMIPFGAKTKEEAQAIANARLKQYTYDGYTGSITGFGIPTVHAGDSLEIIDKMNPERQGTYLVEKITLRYNIGGFERECELSYKI